jgi:diguanylate cyclase (GGDEF)-like protein
VTGSCRRLIRPILIILTSLLANVVWAQSTAFSPAASGSTATPPWKTEYFDGDARCDEFPKVRAAENAARWTAFDPAEPVLRPLKLWLRVSSDIPITLSTSWIAAANTVRMSDFVVALPPPAAIKRQSLVRPERPYENSPEWMVVTLPSTLVPQEPWYFCLMGSYGASSAAFVMQPAATFREADLVSAQRTAGFLGVMLTVMLSALFFGSRLKDGVYLSYAGHVAGFVTFQTVTKGLMSRWLDFLPAGYPWVAAVQFIGIGVSVCFAAHFISTFLSVAQLLPRADRWLRRLAWLTLAQALLSVILLAIFSASPYWRGEIGFFASNIQNVLTAATCVLALSLCAYLAIKRRRFALYLVVGWLPLLVVSILSASEIITQAKVLIWSEWLLPAAAFEGLVLSLGMAARTLDLRNERDVARRSAEIDALTGVLNRRGVFDRLETLQADVATSERQHALLYCDLDFFKHINDQHGHDAGDACLQHFVTCARSVLRREDEIGRLGGEEFVLLLNAQNDVQSLAVAERLRSKLRASPALWRNTSIPITVSIGVSRIDAQTGFAAALSKGDAALYRAKAEGRDRVSVA